MEIHEFLETHPLISISGIERACGITHGALRKGKEIPDGYKEQVGLLLKDYGYSLDMVAESSVVLRSGSDVKSGTVKKTALSASKKASIQKTTIVVTPKTSKEEITEVVADEVEEKTAEQEEPLKNDSNEDFEEKEDKGESESDRKWKEKQERLNNFKKNNNLF